MSCLEAFPKRTLIAIGTHGFTHRLDNRCFFASQVDKVVNELEPTGIVVYGPVGDDIFGITRLKGIPVYQYDSYTMRENKKDKERKLSEGKPYERK